MACVYIYVFTYYIYLHIYIYTHTQYIYILKYIKNILRIAYFIKLKLYERSLSIFSYRCLIKLVE